MVEIFCCLDLDFLNCLFAAGATAKSFEFQALDAQAVGVCMIKVAFDLSRMATGFVAEQFRREPIERMIQV